MSKWGSVDFKQLQELQERIERLSQFDADKFCRDCANEIAALLYAIVVEETPTGRIPGWIDEKAKSQWSNSGFGTLKKGWSVQSIRKNDGYYEVEIINPVEYASYFEYGHKSTPGRYVPKLGLKLKTAWVEGNFILTNAEKSVQAKASNIIEKKLHKLLNEALNT